MAAHCKLSLLDLGRLDVDDGFFIRGATAAVQSNPHPGYDRRRVAVVAAVIEHPQAGPILFDTGCTQNAEADWPAPAWDAFPRNVYDDHHHLDNALAAAGYGIGDIHAVVMGHLHLDHAGGLENFAGTDVPIYAHELEIKQHYYAVATKEDIGAYLPGDLNWQLNWQPLHREETELFDGLIVRHMPGHTPGLLTMQVQTQNSGHFMLNSDLYQADRAHRLRRPGHPLRVQDRITTDLVTRLFRFGRSHGRVGPAGTGRPDARLPAAAVAKNLVTG